MSLAPFSGMNSYDTYTDLNPNNSLDLDTTRPDTPGLEDYQRPSVDSKYISHVLVLTFIAYNFFSRSDI